MQHDASRFKGVNHTHHFTEAELKVMNGYESFDYMPNDCATYRSWLKSQPSRLDWDRWLIMGLIGIVMGIVGFVLHQVTVILSDLKWSQTKEYLEV